MVRGPSTLEICSLSEQQFVDGETTDSGCNGGWMDNAFSFAQKFHLYRKKLPLHRNRRTCNLSGCHVGIPLGGVVGYTDVSTNSEQTMMSAVAQQLVSTAIKADQSPFQLYSSGVLSSPCGARLDHVLSVGYGADAGTDYWKVKNSWGSSWSEQGYIRLQRGKDGAGECGLLAGPPSGVVL